MGDSMSTDKIEHNKCKLSNEDIEALKKCSQNLGAKNEDTEYLCDGPIKYPPRRELTDEEKRIIKERHKKLGIED